MVRGAAGKLGYYRDDFARPVAPLYHLPLRPLIAGGFLKAAVVLIFRCIGSGEANP